MVCHVISLDLSSFQDQRPVCGRHGQDHRMPLMPSQGRWTRGCCIGEEGLDGVEECGGFRPERVGLSQRNACLIKTLLVKISVPGRSPRRIGMPGGGAFLVPTHFFVNPYRLWKSLGKYAAANHLESRSLLHALLSNPCVTRCCNLLSILVYCYSLHVIATDDGNGR